MADKILDPVENLTDQKAHDDGLDVQHIATSTTEKKEHNRVKPVVSVVLPVKNRAQSIQAMFDDLTTGMTAYGKSWELIFIDDASTDQTWENLDRIAQDNDHVKLIKMRSSFGESCALDAGLKFVEGERVVYAASRIQPNLRQIVGLLQKLDEGNDLVVGYRWPRKDSELNQRISRWFNAIVHKLTGVKLNDINSSVFAATKEVLANITFYGNLNIFIPLLAAQKGYRITEEKIEQLPGEFRQSTHFSEYISRALDIITVIFLTNYSKKPLHFLGFFGMIFTIIGGGTSLYLFLYRLLGFGAIAGRPMLLLGALMLVIGLQMISIGLIGEMIIYTHAREIQEYDIETVVCR